jgi:hypothetical protein
MEALGLIDHLGIRDGLLDLKIECLYIADCGDLWIGTQSRGIVKFDGHRFEEYGREKGLLDESVYSISEDKNGKIIIGTNKGLFSLFEDNFSLLKGSSAYSLLWGVDKSIEGKIWFGLNGNISMNPGVLCWDGHQVKLINLRNEKTEKSESINCIKCHNDKVWAGGNSLYVVSSNDYSISEIDTSDIGFVYCIVRDLERNSMLVGTSSGIWAIDDNYQIKLQGYFDNCVDIFIDKYNHINAVSYNGKLARFKGETVDIIYNFNSIIVSNAYVDSVNRYWVGTYGMGLYCYDQSRIDIFDIDHGLPDEKINSLVQAYGGITLAGSRSDLIVSDGRDFQKISHIDKRTPVEITQLCLVDSNVIGGTRNGFLLKITDDLKYKIISSNDLGTDVHVLTEDGKGNVYYSYNMSGVIHVYDSVKNSVVHEFHIDEIRNITSIMVDRKGDVWVGVVKLNYDYGLYCIEDSLIKDLTDVIGVRITSLCVDKKDDIWVGTVEGLFKFDRIRVKKFDLYDGFSGVIISFLMFDQEDKLWIGTEGNGIYVFDGIIFQNINFNNPALNKINSLYKGDNDEIWFSTEGGIIKYKSNKEKPIVEIKSIEAFGEEVDLSREIYIPTNAGNITESCRAVICFRFYRGSFSRIPQGLHA